MGLVLLNHALVGVDALPVALPTQAEVSRPAQVSPSSRRRAGMSPRSLCSWLRWSSTPPWPAGRRRCSG